jgi:hypothetical protein
MGASVPSEELSLRILLRGLDTGEPPVVLSFWPSLLPLLRPLAPFPQLTAPGFVTLSNMDNSSSHDIELFKRGTDSGKQPEEA